MSHTPGPWIVRFPNMHWPGVDGPGVSIVVFGYGEPTPDDDECGVQGRTHEEALANARLIASAPDLLEALRDFVAMGEQYEWDKARTGRDLLMRNARAAIAKAEGR